MIIKNTVSIMLLIAIILRFIEYFLAKEKLDKIDNLMWVIILQLCMITNLLTL